MLKFGQFVVRFRIPLLVLIAGLTVFFGYKALDLKVNSDVVTYLPPDEEAVLLFKKVGNTFGGNSMVLVVLESEGESIFTTDGLSLVRKVARSVEKLEGVHNTVSISNILDIRKTEDGIDVTKLIGDEIPTDADELAELQAKALSKDMYNGKLVSGDGKRAIVVVRMSEGADRGVLAFELKKNVGQVLEEHGRESSAGAGYNAYFGGLPIWTAALSEIILEDIVFLVPVVALVLIIILLLSFRSIRGVVLPLLNVGVAVVWVLGVMSLLEMRLTMISDVIPVLLMAIGSAYGIHFINAYNEDLQPGELPRDRLPKVTARIGVPIVMAALTTFAGFISFVTSYLSLFKEFGILSAMGVVFSFVLALTMIPAILSFLPARKQTASAGPELPLVRRALTAIGRSAASHRLVWGPIFVVLGGLLVWGGSLVHRSVNLSEYFQDDHYIRKSDRVIDAHFGGVAPIQILVRGDIKDPFVLKKMLEVEKYLDSLPKVSGATSVASMLAEVNYQLYDRYAIPDTAEGVANLYFNLEQDDVLERLVYPTGVERPTMALIQAFMSTADSAMLVSTSATVREYLSKNSFAQWDLQLVEQGTRFGPGLSGLQKERVARAAQLIRFDLVKRLADGSEVELPDVEQLILGAMSADYSNDAEVVAGLTTLLSDYFADEAVIEPTSEELEKFEQAVGKPDVFYLTEVKLTELITGILGEENSADERMVRKTIRDIFKQYNNYACGVVVSKATAALLEKLPEDLAGNEWVKRDISGNLWELMDGYWFSDEVAGNSSGFLAEMVQLAQATDPESAGGFGVTSPFKADAEAVMAEALLTPFQKGEVAELERVSQALSVVLKGIGGLTEGTLSKLNESIREALESGAFSRRMVADELMWLVRGKPLTEAWKDAGEVVAEYEKLVRRERDTRASRLIEQRIDSKNLGDGEAVEAYSAAVAALADKAVPASASMFSATGMPRIYEEMDNNLISSQLQSLLIALLLTFILLTIQFRSLGAGAIAVVPIVFTVAGEFGLMAFAGVALDTATVLIASLAVGIGIDYTIHYMSRLKIEAERNPGTLEAISATSRTTGVAIAINAASVAAGFFILVFANLVPLQNFGWMTATTMLISAFAALTLLPMLLSFGKGAARLVGRRNHGSK